VTWKTTRPHARRAASAGLPISGGASGSTRILVALRSRWAAPPRPATRLSQCPLRSESDRSAALPQRRRAFAENAGASVGKAFTTCRANSKQIIAIHNLIGTEAAPPRASWRANGSPSEPLQDSRVVSAACRQALTGEYKMTFSRLFEPHANSHKLRHIPCLPTQTGRRSHSRARKIHLRHGCLRLTLLSNISTS
jgi:hypothetical protein